MCKCNVHLPYRAEHKWRLKPWHIADIVIRKRYWSEGERCGSFFVKHAVEWRITKGRVHIWNTPLITRDDMPDFMRTNSVRGKHLGTRTTKCAVELGPAIVCELSVETLAFGVWVKMSGPVVWSGNPKHATEKKRKFRIRQISFDLSFINMKQCSKPRVMRDRI